MVVWEQERKDRVTQWVGNGRSHMRSSGPSANDPQIVLPVTCPACIFTPEPRHSRERCFSLRVPVWSSQKRDVRETLGQLLRNWECLESLERNTSASKRSVPRVGSKHRTLAFNCTRTTQSFMEPHRRASIDWAFQRKRVCKKTPGRR